MRCGLANFGWRGPFCPKLKILSFFCPPGFRIPALKGPQLAAFHGPRVATSSDLDSWRHLDHFKYYSKFQM